MSPLWAQQGKKTQVLDKMLQSIPSPVEISSLIQKNGIEYDKTLLHKPDKVYSYRTDYKRALNFGIYSTDLGYANLYKQRGDAFAYLNCVKVLSDSLKVGQFIDLMAIAQLADSSMNVLLAETSITFGKINDYLWQQEKSELAALMLVGGWLESLYLTAKLAKNVKNAEKTFSSKELNERIVDQKIILKQMLDILVLYKDTNQDIEKLHQDLLRLSQAFENFKINTKVKGGTQFTIEEINGVEIVVYDYKKKQEEKSIEIAEEDLEKVLEITTSIKSNITE